MGSPEYFGRDLEAMHFASNYHNWIIEEFKPYLGSYIAEVGAGTGNFSALILKSQVDKLVAFEPCKNMHALLQERLAHMLNVEPINSIFSTEYDEHKNQFDSIVYVNVLEHIEHDKNELQYAHDMLKKDGHIFIFVPALDWLYSNFDKAVGHYRRYNKNELTGLVETAGFQIIKAKYFDFIGVIPWYLMIVLLKKELNHHNVSAYDNLVVPIMKKLESMITPPIGKNLILVGKKICK